MVVRRDRQDGEGGCRVAMLSRAPAQTYGLLQSSDSWRVVLMAVLLLCLLLPSTVWATALVVKVRGLDKDTAKTVRNALSITPLAPDPESSIDDIRRAHRRAPDEITQVLATFGFYQPRVEASLEEIDETWFAIYQVDAGPAIKVTELDLQIAGAGRDHPPLVEFKSQFPLQTGDRFQDAVYERAKRKLLAKAVQDGFLDAKLIRHKVELDRRGHTARIRLHLQTGERYYFGSVKVIQEEFSSEFIQKFITLEEGQPYSSAAILEQQTALGDSDYFKEVYVQPRRDLAKNHVIPIEITPVLRKPNKYSIGFGFSTDTGIRGSLGWERRRLNRHGHRLRAGIDASRIGGGVGARYRIPIGNPRYDEFAITAAYLLERPENSESRITQLGFSRMVRRGNWRETIALDFQQEDFEVGIQEDTSRLMVPSIDYTLRVPRRQLFVPKGHRFSTTLSAAHDKLLSDDSFLQTRIFTKWILPMGKRARFLTRGDIGYSAVDTVFDLPASYRFFAGGDQSIRGYGFASLGPTDPFGLVIGGKHLVVGSVEMEYRIIGKWSAAVFFDAGNAFNDFDDLDVAQGAGVGARWTSPIGQIRLDVASAISEPGQPWRIHISIGPDL